MAMIVMRPLFRWGLQLVNFDHVKSVEAYWLTDEEHQELLIEHANVPRGYYYKVIFAGSDEKVIFSPFNAEGEIAFKEDRLGGNEIIQNLSRVLSNHQ